MGCSCDITSEGGVAATGPSFAFYRDHYGGSLDVESYAEAMPAALRLLREICGGVGAAELDDTDLLAWGRACCAACEAFAEFGEGRVGGYAIGDFRVTNYMERGTTGLEVARQAALSELAGTGLAFAGAGRP
jgi:hypothetical protein